MKENISALPWGGDYSVGRPRVETEPSVRVPPKFFRKLDAKVSAQNTLGP